MRISASAALGCGFLFFVWLTSSQAGESTPAWETEWNQIVEAAKKNGQVTIYHTRGPFDEVFAEFHKRYPGIKVVSVTGRGGELSSRIMGERRAGKFLTDMYLGASCTPLDVLYPAKILEPVPPVLISLRSGTQSNWFRRQHQYADPEGKYIFVFEGLVRSDMAYNTTLVDPKESLVPIGICSSPSGKERSLRWIPSCPAFQRTSSVRISTIRIWAPNSYDNSLVRWISPCREKPPARGLARCGKICHRPCVVRQRGAGGYEAWLASRPVRATGI